MSPAARFPASRSPQSRSSRRLIAFLAVIGGPLSGAVVSLWEFENNTNSSNSSYNATAAGSPGYAAGYIG